jgi:hypothetical protein
MLPFPVRRLAAGLLTTAGLATGAVRLMGQAPQAPTAMMIQSLAEPGEGLTIRSRSERSGLVTFASSQQSGIRVALLLRRLLKDGHWPSSPSTAPRSVSHHGTRRDRSGRVPPMCLARSTSGCSSCTTVFP